LFTRQQLDLPSSGGDDIIGIREYLNISKVTGAIISSGKASFWELDNHLSIEDAFDILEVMQVDNYNQSIVARKREKSYR
jgi:hypothetical protein